MRTVKRRLVELLRRITGRPMADRALIRLLELRLGLVDERMDDDIPLMDDRRIMTGAAAMAYRAGLSLDDAADYARQWAASEAPPVPDLPPAPLSGRPIDWRKPNLISRNGQEVINRWTPEQR